MRVIFGPIKVENPPLNNVPPGTVLEAKGSRLVISAGQGAVVPQSLQPAGKKSMSIDEFLRGHHVRPGDRFGPEE